MGWVTAFAVVFTVAQLVTGTDLVFAVLSFAYLMLAGLGFNLAGGLVRPVGAYMFFNAMEVMLVPLLGKIGMGEPGESNLVNGDLVMQIYTLGMLGLLLAVFLDRAFRPKLSLFETKLRTPDLGRAAFMSYVFGFPPVLVTALMAQQAQVNGSLLGYVRQLSLMLPMAIMIDVQQTVRKTNGRRSLNLRSASVIGITTLAGLLSFSKEGMFTPFLVWFIAACSAGYKLKWRSAFAAGALFFLLLYYGTVVAQFGRTYKTESISDNAAMAVALLQNFAETREQYAEQKDEQRGRWNYYNQNSGLLDRMQLFTEDDALIQQTEEHGYFGLLPLWDGLVNVVPHVIYKNKSQVAYGNFYMREMGGLPPDDTTTGITFSIYADAYHEAGYVGLLVVLPVVMAGLFLIISFVIGGSKVNPLGLAAILVMGHAGPEWALWNISGLATMTVQLTAVALFYRYLIPVLGTIFSKPGEARPVGAPAMVQSLGAAPMPAD